MPWDDSISLLCIHLLPSVRLSEQACFILRSTWVPLMLKRAGIFFKVAAYDLPGRLEVACGPAISRWMGCCIEYHVFNLLDTITVEQD